MVLSLKGRDSLNSLDKVVGIALIVLLMFLVPLQDSARKADAISQIYISNETTEFVNNIKNKGYITVEMYKRFIQNIDKTNNLYDIQIIHSHRLVEPLVNVDGIVEGHYAVRYFNTYQDEILKTFDKGNIYYFSQGDYINVSIKNRNKTLADRITVSNGKIFVTYGGMIRDEFK